MDKIKKHLSYAYSLDLRSIALFRVSISLVLFYDIVFTRLPFLKEFHVSDTFVPKYALFNYLKSTQIFFFDPLSYSAYWWAVLIVILTAFFAFNLLVGYYSRLSAFLCWLFLAGFQTNNPLILNNGDALLLLLLFFSMFLPLGERFSVDSALLKNKKQSQENSFFSISSFSIITQILILYVVTHILKDHPIWQNGDAIYYSLNLEIFRRPLGAFLLQFPLFMKGATFTTLWFFELMIPILVFFNFFKKRDLIRLVACSSMILFHVGLALTLAIGTFPFICISAWLLLLPSSFWKMFKRKKLQDFTVYYDKDCDFCHKLTRILKTFFIIPHAKILPAQSNEDIFSKMKKYNSWIISSPSLKKDLYAWEAFVFFISQSYLLFWSRGFLSLKPIKVLGKKAYYMVSQNRKFFGVFISFLKFSNRENKETKESFFLLKEFFVLICISSIVIFNIRNIYNIKVPSPSSDFVTNVVYRLKFNQNWGMFAPQPTLNNGWLFAEAETKSGEKIDLLRKGRPFSFKTPKWGHEDFPTFRHRKLINNITSTNIETFKPFQPYYAHFLCYYWNFYEKKEVKNIKLKALFRYTPAPGKLPEPLKTITFWSKNCNLK